MTANFLHSLNAELQINWQGLADRLISFYCMQPAEDWTLIISSIKLSIFFGQHPWICVPAVLFKAGWTSKRPYMGIVFFFESFPRVPSTTGEMRIFFTEIQKNLIETNMPDVE